MSKLFITNPHKAEHDRLNFLSNFFAQCFVLNPLIRIYNFKVFFFILLDFNSHNTSSRSALPTKLHFPSCCKRRNWMKLKCNEYKKFSKKMFFFKNCLNIERREILEFLSLFLYDAVNALKSCGIYF